MIIFDRTYITDSKIFPDYCFKFSVPVNTGLLVVLFLVTFVSLVVFESVFEHRNSDNKGKRDQERWNSVGIAHFRDHLKKSYEKKVDIGRFFELQIEILGHEIKLGVFCSRYLIVDVQHVRLAHYYIPVPQVAILRLLSSNDCR